MSFLRTSIDAYNTARRMKLSLSGSQRDNVYLALGTSSSLGYSDDDLRKMSEKFIHFKKITAADVSFVIPRNDWVYLDTYNYWCNSDANLTTNCYVTSSDKLYLCVSNNSGNASVQAPSTTGTSLETTRDGYKWKYLCTIDTSKYPSTMTDWIPIETNETVAAAAIAGGIEHIEITDGGTYPTNSTYYLVMNEGIATGANFYGTANVVDNEVQSICIKDPGFGYSNVANVYMNYTGAGAGTSSVSNAILTVVVSPPDGHGYNIERELRAHHLMINTTIGEVGSSTGTVTYKSRAIVVNPIDLSNDEIATGSTYNSGSIALNSGDITCIQTIPEGVTHNNLNETENINIILEY